MARDLHDTLAHTLAGLAVQINAINALLKGEQPEVRRELAYASQMVEDGLVNTRQAIGDVRANAVVELGLGGALRRQVELLSQRSGAQATFEQDDDVPELRDEAANTLFRIAQEALTNIERHARAQHVGVALRTERGETSALVLSIRDDGIGFDTADLDDQRFGLRGMRERAELIGAHLRLDSAVGEGTQVTIKMPLLALGFTRTDPHAAGHGLSLGFTRTDPHAVPLLTMGFARTDPHAAGHGLSLGFARADPHAAGHGLSLGFARTDPHAAGTLVTGIHARRSSRRGARLVTGITRATPMPHAVPCPYYNCSMAKIRVLVADDQEIVRRGLTIIIDQQEDMTMIGQAENGEQAVELARALKPDVVLMDIKMPRLNGIQATRAIAGELPETRVIILTTYDVDDLGV